MKLSTLDSKNVNQRKTGMSAMRASVIALGRFRNSLRSDRFTAPPRHLPGPD